MRTTPILRAASHARTPLIKFLGKRKAPASVDHTPHTHPASPNDSLPQSFAQYRIKAQQYGPLNGGMTRTPSHAYGAIGGSPGRQLGAVQPKQGEYFDRSELPQRFRRTPFTDIEMDAIQTAGASLYT